MARTRRGRGRTVVNEPPKVVSTANRADIRAVLDRAREADMVVAPLGAALSTSGLAATDGLRLTAPSEPGIIEVDRQHRRAWLSAGARMSTLSPRLAKHDLAFANLGDFHAQTIAGAISTGTHGTGLGYAGLSAYVRGLRMVLADGTAVEIDAQHQPRLFQAARLGLGALGVITAVNVQCVPAFALHLVEEPEPLEEVLESFTRRIRVSDHFSFFWFPRTGTAVTKQTRRLPPETTLHPRPTGRRLLEDVLEDTAFRWSCRMGSKVPQHRRLANQVVARVISPRDVTDVSYQVFMARRRVRFHEVEYGLPLPAFRGAFEDIRRIVEAERNPTSLPVEVRLAERDDVWLSPAYRRPTVYLAVKRFYQEDHRPLFGKVEAVLRSYGGRPHWGKLHTMTADDLAAAYPRFSDFRSVRMDVDPQGRFLTPYLRSLLLG